jgi:hypothetical protein
MTEQYRSPDWDRRAVVRAFVSELRRQGPGHAGFRVAVGLVVVVIVLVAVLAFGFLTRPAPKAKNPASMTAVRIAVRPAHSPFGVTG